MNVKKTNMLGKVMLLQLLAFCIHSIIASLTAHFLGQSVSMAIGCVTISAVFLLPVLLYRNLTGRKIADFLVPKSTDDRTRNQGKTVLLFIFALCMTLTAVNLLGQLTELVLSFTDKPKAVFPTGAVQYVLFFIRNVFLAALLEELLLRGVALDALDSSESKAKILISALLFALIHYSLRSFLYSFAAGVVLGYFAIKTGSLAFSVAVHFTQNLTSFVFTLLSGILPQGIYNTVLFISFTMTAIIALIGVIYLIFKSKKCVSIEPEIKKTEKFHIRTAFCTELVLFIISASVLTIFNF